MERLKELRIKNGISQQKLADEFHISQQSIWKYENDLSEPDIAMLIQFANFFNVSVDYLIGNTDIPEKAEAIQQTDRSCKEDINSEFAEKMMEFLSYIAEHDKKMEAGRARIGCRKSENPFRKDLKTTVHELKTLEKFSDSPIIETRHSSKPNIINMEDIE